MGIDCWSHCGINWLYLLGIAILFGALGYVLARWRRWTVIATGFGVILATSIALSGEHPTFYHWLPALGAILIGCYGAKRHVDYRQAVIDT